LCSIRRATFVPIGIIWTTLVEGLLIMLYTKFESSEACSFRQEYVWKLYFESYFLHCDLLMKLSGTVFSSFIKLTLDQVGLDEKSFEDFTLCLQVSYKNEVLNYTVMLLERPSNRMYVTGQKICNCNCKTQIIFGIYHYLYYMYVQIIICYNMAMVC